MQNEIPLFQKIYDFYKLFCACINNFSKKSRETLASKIENTIIGLLESVASAAYTNQNEKYSSILNASAKVDFLKILFRLCYELKIINQKKYLLMEEKSQEIGRMLGGWIKSLKTSDRS